MKVTLVRKTAVLSTIFSFLAFVTIGLCIVNNSSSFARGGNRALYGSVSFVQVDIDQVMQTYYAKSQGYNADYESADGLSVQLSEGIREQDITFDYDYVKRTLEVTIATNIENYFDDNAIYGTCQGISDISYGYCDGQVKLLLELDSVYEYQTQVVDSVLNIKFIDPHELYDHVVVIDAGHGGIDGGTIGFGNLEKDINLDIMLRLKEMFDDQSSIKVYYTRTTDMRPSYEERVSLANDVNADLFLSIHCNACDSSQANGTEVMYNELASYEGFGTKEFAQICQDSLVQSLQTRDRGLINGNAIYIIRNAQVPVALVELGYITNQSDCDLLLSEEGQGQAAAGIYNAIVTAVAQ